jgi:hypothetical protein
VPRAVHSHNGCCTLEDDAADWLDSHVVYFASMDYIRCSARITIAPKTAIITKPSGS